MNRIADDFDLEYIDVAHISPSPATSRVARPMPSDGWEGADRRPRAGRLAPDGGMRMVFGGIRSLDHRRPLRRGLPLPDQLRLPIGTELDVGALSRRRSRTRRLRQLRAPARRPSPTAPWSRRTPQRRHDLLPGRRRAGADASTSPTCCAYDLALAQDGVRRRVRRVVRQRRRCRATWATLVRTDLPDARVRSSRCRGSVSTFGGEPAGTIANSQTAAMAARNGGGVYIAFLPRLPHLPRTSCCGSYGTGKVAEDSRSSEGRHARRDLCRRPSGRLWIAFEDDRPTTSHAVRTDTCGVRVRRRAHPPAAQVRRIRLQASTIEGTRARADLLFNDATRIWHQQLVRRSHPRRRRLTSGTARTPSR